MVRHLRLLRPESDLLRDTVHGASDRRECILLQFARDARAAVTPGGNRPRGVLRQPDRFTQDAACPADDRRRRVHGMQRPGLGSAERGP